MAEGAKGRFNITRGNLHTFLGPPKYIPEMDQEPSQIGLATGLAWTNVGGEVLYIEATLIKGKGELIITGQLGDVMQESARAALSYIRSNLGVFGIRRDRLDNRDIHLHVPAGAIPKDGPSAGVAMATALISVLTRKPVDHRVATTGEITIRGRVLPIGGLKEKALGAIRAGIKTLVLPAKNGKDLAELPPLIKRKLRLVTVEDMDAVLPLVFDPWPPAKRGKGHDAAAKVRGR
jgi:ATP-dependent Lon protease